MRVESRNLKVLRPGWKLNNLLEMNLSTIHFLLSTPCPRLKPPDGTPNETREDEQGKGEPIPRIENPLPPTPRLALKTRLPDARGLRGMAIRPVEKIEKSNHALDESCNSAHEEGSNFVHC
jgi:hypothetical protein